MWMYKNQNSLKNGTVPGNGNSLHSLFSISVLLIYTLLSIWNIEGVKKRECKTLESCTLPTRGIAYISTNTKEFCAACERPSRAADQQNIVETMIDLMWFNQLYSITYGIDSKIPLTLTMPWWPCHKGKTIQSYNLLNFEKRVQTIYAV